MHDATVYTITINYNALYSYVRCYTIHYNTLFCIEQQYRKRLSTSTPKDHAITGNVW